jgi:hypothetical protein
MQRIPPGDFATLSVERRTPLSERRPSPPTAVPVKSEALWLRGTGNRLQVNSFPVTCNLLLSPQEWLIHFENRCWVPGRLPHTHLPGTGGRRGIDIARRVYGPHREGVRAAGQVREALRGGASGVSSFIQLALEGGVRL